MEPSNDDCFEKKMIAYAITEFVDVVKIDNLTPVVCLVHPYSHLLVWSGLGLARLSRGEFYYQGKRVYHSYLSLSQINASHVDITDIAGFAR